MSPSPPESPAMLSDPERQVLVVYCSEHPVAICWDCRRDYKFSELGVDVIGRRYYFCPTCRLNLVDRVRLHILSCSAISAALDESIIRGVEAIKESDRLSTQSAVLAAESHDLARRVLDTKRESSHVPGAPTVIKRLATILLNGAPICADCLAREADMPSDAVRERIERMRVSVRVTIETGTCRECRRRRDIIIMRLG